MDGVITSIVELVSKFSGKLAIHLKTVKSVGNTVGCGICRVCRGTGSGVGSGGLEMMKDSFNITKRSSSASVIGLV